MDINLENLPLFLKFNVYKNFENIKKNLKNVAIINNDTNEYFFTKKFIFDDISEILKYIYEICKYIINMNLFDFIDDKISNVFIDETILTTIYDINNISKKYEDIYIYFIKQILYEHQPYTIIINYENVDYYIIKNSEIENFKTYLQILYEFVVILYRIVLYLSNIMLNIDKQNQRNILLVFGYSKNIINETNNFLINFILLLKNRIYNNGQKIDIDDNNVYEYIFDNYEEYINHELYLQYYIRDLVFKSSYSDIDKNIYMKIGPISDYIFSFFYQYKDYILLPDEILEYDSLSYIIIDQLKDFLIKYEQYFYVKTNFSSIINDKIFNNCENVDIDKLSFTYMNTNIISLRDKNIYETMISEIKDVFKNCKIPTNDELVNSFKKYYNNKNENDKFYYYTFYHTMVKFIFTFKNYDDFNYELLNFLSQITQMTIQYYHNDEIFFYYIYLLAEISLYKKQSIYNDIDFKELFIKIDKLIYDIFKVIKIKYEEFYRLIVFINDKLLKSSSYNFIDFIYEYYSIIIYDLLDIQDINLENQKSEIKLLYEEFEDLKILFVENQPIEPLYSELSKKFFEDFYEDLKEISLKINNIGLSKEYIKKIYNSKNLLINFNNYYLFEPEQVSIISFNKFNLLLDNGNTKNVIILGEFHEGSKSNYAYIQNELYICKTNNIYLDFLIEDSIYNYYNIVYKQNFNEYHNEIKNTFWRFSPCYGDEKLQNILYSNKPSVYDDILCFDNVWYQNIDYRMNILNFYNYDFIDKAKENFFITAYKDITEMNNTNIEIFYLRYFRYENMLLSRKNIFPKFIQNNFIKIFNINYPYDNILYKFIVNNVDIVKLRKELYDKVVKLSKLYNECLGKNIDVFTQQDKFLNKYVIKDSFLYKKLKNIKLEFLTQKELEYMVNKINNLTHDDIYQTLIINLFDVYNSIYDKYYDVKNINNLFIFQDKNVYGYRTFKFLKKISKYLDSNIFLNIIICFLTGNKNLMYNQFTNIYIEYNEIFGKIKIFEKNPLDDLLIKDCLIDVNIIYRLFYEYDTERKKQRQFPIDTTKTLIYVGDAHRRILLMYLMNGDGLLVYKKNNVEFTNPFINQVANIENSSKVNKSLIPSIYENFVS